MNSLQQKSPSELDYKFCMQYKIWVAEMFHVLLAKIKKAI